MSSDHNKAAECFNAALKIDPTAAIAHGQLGVIYQVLYLPLLCINVKSNFCFSTRIKMKSKKPSNHSRRRFNTNQTSLIMVKVDLFRVLDFSLISDFLRLALLCFRIAVFAKLEHVLEMVCDWTDYDGRMKRLVGIIQKQLERHDMDLAVHALHSLVYPISHEQRKGIAVIHAERCLRKVFLQFKSQNKIKICLKENR